MRLIDADALMEKTCARLSIKGPEYLLPAERDVYKVIDEAPTIDAVPVRHGRWETDGMPMDDGEYLMTRCTACGTPYEYGHNDNYCGFCGARMDGK